MFALFKTAKWNRDPNQKKLAEMLLAGAKFVTSSGGEGKRLDIREMMAFTSDCGWRSKEASDRFVHAVSMIKPIASVETYGAAKEIALNLYNAYRATRL
jgi:hypothetical protein